MFFVCYSTLHCVQSLNLRLHAPFPFLSSPHRPIPSRRYKNVDLAGLDKALQKADHYFFGANVPPHLMVMDDPDEDKWYNPDGSVRPVQLNTPRDLLAESKLIKDGFDEEAVEDLETVLSSKVFNSRDGVVKQLQHIYAEAAADARGDNGPGANHTVQRPLDLERFRGAPDFVPREPGTEADYITDEQREISRAMTLKERRVEFWGKFQEQMTFIETAVTGSVRVTRATGRVRSSYVVTIMGNEKGVVCYGRGKGATSELAMRRSIYAAPRNMMYVPLHEKRTIFIPCVGKFKRTMVFAKPMPREFGLHVPPHLYDLVEALGIQDISIKVMGSRNRYNVLQAFMEVLKQQVSYRELAMRRGMHYETMMDPFHKNPPPPTKAELAEIEKDASEQFAKAVEATIRNRDLVQVPPYEEFEPVLELREEFKQSWQRHLDTKGVPPALQRFPPFSEYLDTLKALENGEEDLLGVADDPMFEEDEDLEMLNADVEENYNDNDARHHESDYPTENEEEEEDSSYERHETRGQKYSVQV